MAKTTRAKTDQKPKKAKKKKVSYQKQPEELTLRQWQVELRRQYGKEQRFELSNQGDHPVWSDFSVANPERNTVYRVALRDQEPGANFCECYDFRTNTLGTCKHIEWALHKLFHTYGNKQHFRKPPPERTYSSVFLHYGEERTVRLRIGTDHTDALRRLAEPYFDAAGQLYPHAYLEFDQFLERAYAIAPDFRCYPDALDFIIEKRADERRRRLVADLRQRERPLDGLLQTELYPYQHEGVLFALEKGRCLLADEMGLGKTLQAIGAAELYRREMGISSVFIICPTSLKYQWRSEIRKFTDSSVLVIEGPQHQRREQYSDQNFFYKILTYNVVARDYEHLNAAAPDLLVLDEAQRIKNWDTKISRAVKRLNAPYRLALTGTPLENKLEDIYSITQFLDQFLLGPLFLLLERHQARDEHGIVRGYRRLDEIHAKLRDVMLRRRKRDVKNQMPDRLDQHILVAMTPGQWQLHQSYESDVAQLIAKWRRMGFLTEKDRQRLLSLLNLMRMSCNSTYLVDQRTRHDNKIDELFYILEEKLAVAEEKVVIFSQWERMTRLVAQELEARELPFAYLHGGIPSSKRGELLDRFREDDACRVFLSTDAGGVGLNLQTAALIVNLDLPWNPAVLEQRIGRVYRLGQKRTVQVVNLISEGTIEHRMVQTLKFKSSLAEAILDTAEERVFMSQHKFREFMENLEKMQGVPLDAQVATADTDEDLETKPGPGRIPEAAEPADDWQESPTDAPDAPRTAPPAGTAPAPAEPTTPKRDTAGQGARELVASGVSFLGRLAQTLADERATRELVEEIVERDEATGQTYLKIPVESQAVVHDAIRLLGGLFAGAK